MHPKDAHSLRSIAGMPASNWEIEKARKIGQDFPAPNTDGGIISPQTTAFVIDKTTGKSGRAIAIYLRRAKSFG